MKLRVDSLNATRSTSSLEKEVVRKALLRLGKIVANFDDTGELGSISFDRFEIGMPYPLSEIESGRYTVDTAANRLAHMLWLQISSEMCDELADSFLVGFGKHMWEDVVSGAARDRIFAYGEGMAEGVYAAAEGMVDMVLHPIDTVEGVVTAVVNYDQTLAVIEAKLAEYWEAASGDPEKFAKMTGHLVGEIVAGIASAKGANMLKGSKAAQVAKAKQTEIANKLRKQIAANYDKMRKAKLPKDALSGYEYLVNRGLEKAAYKTYLQRFKQVEEEARKIRAMREQVGPGDGALAEAERLLQQKRMGASGTVRGSHGGAGGGNGADLATKNWLDADRMVKAWAKEGDEITIERIQELNRTLGEGLEHNGGTPGKIRTPEDQYVDKDGMRYPLTAGGNMMKSYVDYAQVMGALDDFVAWYERASKTMPTVELAARSYQRLVSIHPFLDANGRTCRMVMDWILQSKGLPAAALDDVNVAVFGNHAVYDQLDKAVSASKAIDAVLKGVENSLQTFKNAK